MVFQYKQATQLVSSPVSLLIDNDIQGKIWQYFHHSHLQLFHTKRVPEEFIP